MAQPIPLEIPPRNPRAELRSRLEQAPEEHAEAVLAAYEVLEELHSRGVLEIMRGALAASDDILEKVVDNVRTPEAIRTIRNLLVCSRILRSIDPSQIDLRTVSVCGRGHRSRLSSRLHLAPLLCREVQEEKE